MRLNILRIFATLLIASAASIQIDINVDQKGSVTPSIVSQEDCKVKVSKIIETIQEIISQKD